MQNRSVVYKLFQANLYIEGRTYKLVDMAKQKVAFRNFSKAPKSSALWSRKLKRLLHLTASSTDNTQPQYQKFNNQIRSKWLSSVQIYVTK